MEQKAFAVCTTSSEVLQEQGLAIKHFLKMTKHKLPRPIKEKLTACLIETELANPGWRKLIALLRRNTVWLKVGKEMELRNKK